MAERVDLYDNVYADYGSRAEAEVRHQAFGEDIGQSSWLTAAEWLRFADQVQVRKDSEVLEVGSGSGGPAVYLATARGCRITGIDINEHGVRNSQRLAALQGVADRANFQVVDASRPLPLPDATFDAVLSNDAMCHIRNRLDVLGEWHRVLRPGGRMLFTVKRTLRACSGSCRACTGSRRNAASRGITILRKSQRSNRTLYDDLRE